MSAPENPPAFPRDERFLGHNGMSLRDWFAGQALSGCMAAEASDVIYEDRGVANRAYRVADAMLGEREKGVYPTRADLIEALETLHSDARPSNWSDEDQPGEPGYYPAAAWRKLDAVLAAAKGGAG